MFVFFVVSVIPIKPHNGNAVCPLGTVQYFCTANYDELGWKFNGTGIALYRRTGNTYSANNTILKTAPGEITGKHITSTATIESVLIEYDGLSIECNDIGGVASQKIRVEGTCTKCS